MNKKNLSVVMAGAMLATSVAPVLADTTTVEKSEMPINQLGLLKASVSEMLEKKFVDTDLQSTMRGQSVYYFTINGAKKTGSNLNELTTLSSGDIVEIWDNGHREVNGKYYSTTDSATSATPGTMTKSDIEDAAELIYDSTQTGNGKVAAAYQTLLSSAEYNSTDKTLTITFKSLNESLTGNIRIVLKEGSEKVDFEKVISKDGLIYDLGDVVASSASTGQVNASDVVGFAPLTDLPAGSDIEEKKVSEITITGKSERELLLSDIYDGIMLTEKGYEILDAFKEGTITGGKIGITTKDGHEISTERGIISSNLLDSATGIVKFGIKFTDKFGKAQEYIVRSTDVNESIKVAKWFASKEPSIDLIGGTNRYETAVKTAKKAFGNAYKLDGTSNKNIVLVNGTALVDGLAAAPYAKTLNSNAGAPILLSETDSLPKATKEYLNELTDGVTVENKKKTTIHLIGGESVLSRNLVNELKDMGFTVDRIAGDDREGTSLAVAEELGTSIKDAFVVGANGEADAMSIASVAADSAANDTSSVMPIIVSGVHGLTVDALDYLENKTVTVIGGNAQITDTEYSNIDEVSEATRRIEGANRQATNAAIIKEYYNKGMGSKTVLVAKDGMNNKNELVDAMAASILASKEGAPIVLATNKLSDAQINEVQLMTDGTANAIYQIGNGVAKDAIKTLAKRLGLN